jgi:hypothetical protein
VSVAARRLLAAFAGAPTPIVASGHD